MVRKVASALALAALRSFTLSFMFFREIWLKLDKTVFWATAAGFLGGAYRGSCRTASCGST